MTTSRRPPETSGRLVHAGTHALATHHGGFELQLLQDVMAARPVLVVTRGDVRSRAPLPMRVHSACVTSETLGACDCDCAEQLDAALAQIAAEGRGVVVYLMQEGRGAGLSAKARDRMLVQASEGRLDTFAAYAELGLPPDLRRYDVVADACRLLGLEAPVRLLTNNPSKLEALEGLGLELAGAEPLERRASGYNADYLVAKRAAGHRLEVEGWRKGESIEPPGPASVEAPREIAGAPDLLRMGSYWLPISRDRDRAAAPVWLQLAAVLDVARGREHFAVSMGRPAEMSDGTAPVVRVHREQLLERLPLEDRPARAAWLSTLDALVARGAGCIVFPDGVAPGTASGNDRSGDEAAASILHDWAQGAAVEPLVQFGAGAQGLRCLEAAGLTLRPPRLLPAARTGEIGDVERAG